MLKVFAVVIAYFLGAIPTAYLVGKKVKGIDIRKHGSGNVGTTNAFRVLGKGPGTAVLIGDILKGYLAALVCLLAGGEILGLIGAIIAMAGHSWSVFLQFKGGKGVATGAGAFLALMPIPTLIAIGVFIVIIYSTKYVSLGSITAAAIFPIVAFAFAEPLSYQVFSVIAAAVVILRHTSNIKRLLNGTENKIGKKL